MRRSRPLQLFPIDGLLHDCFLIAFGFSQNVSAMSELLLESDAQFVRSARSAQ
jgi:hypothetical protein